MLLTPVVFSTLATQGQLSSALREADAAYRKAEPSSAQASSCYIGEATDDYREILHRFGNVPAAHAGLGRCLLHWGDYSAASSEFKQAGPGFVADVNDALDRRRLALLLGRKLHARRAIQVLVIPGTSTFVATIGREADSAGWGGRAYDRLEIVLARRLKDKVSIVEVQKPRLSNHPSGFAEGSEWSTSDLYLLRASNQASSWMAVLLRRFPAADCSPGAVEALEVSPKGFGHRFLFGTLQEVVIKAASPGHGMLIEVAPTFKVWWPDVYEWRGNRFVFANHAHPELYSKDAFSWDHPETDHYTPHWMIRAAILDIKEEFGAAEKCWKRAEVECLNTIRVGARKWDYVDPGFFRRAKGESRRDPPAPALVSASQLRP